MKKTFSFLILLTLPLFGFDYDLHETSLPGNNGQTTLCLHGMGGDYRIAEMLKKTSTIQDTLVSFNFPDHNFVSGKVDSSKTHFGTIQELLPPLSLLKKLIVDEKRASLNLYGFSAGGGAIINMLAALNTKRFDKDLKEIGIDQSGKTQILAALQKGLIILDTPLKSIAEIVAVRGPKSDLAIIGKRYKQNEMEPIEAIAHLKNLALNIVVHFQAPDEILSNRDDILFINRLRSVNKLGTTEAIIGNDNGHMVPHQTLWRFLNISKAPESRRLKAS